ncbi:MAG: NarL family two-component system response regulator LiaR [Bacteroidia bacterium]|jgi:DNA-binding CsgD family transcriptional regulator
MMLFYIFSIMLPPQHTIITKRETEILRYVNTGMTSSEIANQLSLSKHTVDNHRKNILRKTGSRNMLEMVQWGMKNNLLP